MKFQNIDSETVPQSASFLVKIVHRMSMLLMRNVTAEFGSASRFNIPEWRVASLLYAFGTSRQKELVDRSFADQAQTSRGLADLERTGMVRSFPSGEDRRVKNFELTEEGRREVEAGLKWLPRNRSGFGTTSKRIPWGRNEIEAKSERG